MGGLIDSTRRWAGKLEGAWVSVRRWTPAESGVALGWSPSGDWHLSAVDGAAFALAVGALGDAVEKKNRGSRRV